MTSATSSSATSPSALQQPLSFHHVSSYFNLSLSDAASSLGVCTSVLKRLCHENGLERWPYRKYLAGKSIDEIKRYAARQKVRELATKSKIQGQSASQPQSKETFKLEGVRSPIPVQHEMNKTTAQKANPSLLKILASLDEFKHGFPSEGLLTASHTWWGCKSAEEDTAEDETKGDTAKDEAMGGDTENETKCDMAHDETKREVAQDETKGIHEDNLQSEEKSKDDFTSLEIDNWWIDGTPKKDTAAKQSSSLVDIRKKIATEGREALTLGAYRVYGSKKLGKKERGLLIRLFKSTLPKEWMSDAS